MMNNDIYIEETMEDFKVAPLAVKLHGGLSSRWRTRKLLCFTLSDIGAYLAMDLHRKPHYMERPCRKKYVLNRAMERNVEVKNMSSDYDIHLPEHGFYSWSYATLEVHFAPLSSLFKIVEDDILPVLSSMKETSDRGNVNISLGWASLNIKYDHKNGVTMPQVSKDLQLHHVKAMCLLTDMLRNVYSTDTGMNNPFVGDPVRTSTFALELCRLFDLKTETGTGLPTNVFEGITFALTDDVLTFGCHIDQFNCRVMNGVFVVYWHVVIHDKRVRIAVIGYCRSACYDFLLRRRGRDLLFNNIKGYYNFNKSRQSVPNSSSIPQKGDVVYNLPSFPKYSFYSAFVTIILYDFLYDGG